MALDVDFDILPIESHKEEILAAIQSNQYLICLGETGSGKTTKIPQFVFDSKILGTSSNRIAITQPRRVAAINVAERVASERGVRLSDEVGYSVRFDDKSSSKTAIRYMTDGILVRECLSDPDLSAFGMIILDEAHERSLHTDILFGLVKAACSRRPSLKVLITSATLDTEAFRAYFSNCPVLEVAGRLHEVEIYHSKLRQIMTISGPNMDDYLRSAVDCAIRIHKEEDPGHILVFLTGQDDIEKACAMVRDAVMNDRSGALDDLVVMPLYSSLPTQLQKKVFAKLERSQSSTNSSSHNSHSRSANSSSSRGGYLRKCIFATNIAETSITVAGVRYVVDSGYVKQKAYDPESHMESLVTLPISKVSADQRSGRAGRTGPGKCYRLYSKDSYADMLKETVPEIMRTNLANTALYLKVIGIDDILSFDFLSKPNNNQFIEALVQLHSLGAIDEKGKVTKLGILMANFPLEPKLSRVLIAASNDSKINCVAEVATIAALISTESPWLDAHRAKYLMPSNDKSSFGGLNENEMAKIELESKHGRFRHESGDYCTFLRIYYEWQKKGFSKEFCDDNYLNYRALQHAKKVRDQILDDCLKYGLCSKDSSLSVASPSSTTLVRSITRAVIQGHFTNGMRLCPTRHIGGGGGGGHSGTMYRTMPLDSSDVQFITCHPQSVFELDPIACPPPEHAVYNELVFGGGRIMAKGIIKVLSEDLFEKCRDWTAPKNALALSGGGIASVEAAAAELKSSSYSGNKGDLITQEGEDLNRNKSALQASASISEQSKEVASSTASAIDLAKQRYLERKKAKL